MKLLSALLCCLCALTNAVAGAKTTVSIQGEDFHINDKPTYAGRVWNGHRIEGLLMNSRMVQATYDDLNPETAKRWAYPDTGKWDAERNVREFIAAMPEWKAHGLLAVTVNFQGGSPEGYSGGQPWITGAFTKEGALRPEFAARMKRVLDAADRNGMVVILGYFYFGQDQHLQDEAAVVKATDEATQWLLDGGWGNVLVELNNETNGSYDHEILRPARIHELMERVRKTERKGRRLLVGTSYGGDIIPQENVVRTSDYLLLHGNGVKDPARITQMIAQTKRVPGFHPMPILYNEDDHENFDQPTNNCAASVADHVSWGWFDYRRKGEALAEGYQSPPVNWGISSTRKRAFFNYVATITGTKSVDQSSAKPALDLTKFKLTFSDEFDGNKLDLTKWQAPEMPRQGSCRWVKSLATVHDGALHLGIRLTNDPVLRYDCAAVRTRKDYDPNQTMFAQRYGYFEARAKLPKNMKSDYWAAFWMMCGNVNSPDTREGIEADILESFQQSNVPRYGMNFHWNGYGKEHNATGIKLDPTPALADGEFHRFGMYWDEKVYVAFFDGREVGRTDLIGLGGKDNGKTTSQGPCQKPGYLKLSCEAAAWAGATNQWEKDPTKEDAFVVDYVRVYEGTLPTATNKP